MKPSRGGLGAESKVFKGVLMCLGEKLEKEERESTMPKKLFFIFTK